MNQFNVASKVLKSMNCLTKRFRASLISNSFFYSKFSYSTSDKTEEIIPIKKEDTKGQNKIFKKEIDAITAIPVPIYSRKGDFGKTEISGVELNKDDKIFHAIGATDELSAQLGFAKEFGRQHAYGDKLLRIQILLVNVISVIQKSGIKEKITFSRTYTKELEDWIDEYSCELPPSPVEHSVLPGGGIASAALQVARSTCRRAERNVIPLVKDGVIDQEILAYLNRLSDFLFTVSRFACKMDKQDEYTTSAHHDSPEK